MDKRQRNVMMKSMTCPRGFHIRIYVTALIALCLAVSSCREGDVEGDRAWNDFAAPHRKTADMGGYSMHYIDTGSGIPLVMIHGFADSSYSWHRNAAALKDAGFRLIMMDLPAQGRSDIPGESYVYSVENLSDEVIKLTEQLGLRKFYAVGHSMGGGIALHIMVNRPGRIIRAVLINPVCFKSPGVQILKIPGMEFIAPRLGGRWSVRASLEDAFFNIDLVTEAMVDEYARPIGKPGYYKALISLEKQFYSPEFEKLGRSYRLIHNPVKIIWGSGDTWLSSSQGRELNEMIMDSSIMEMDRCGHAPHQECSDRVTPIMLGFLKE